MDYVSGSVKTDGSVGVYASKYQGEVQLGVGSEPLYLTPKQARKIGKLLIKAAKAAASE